MTRNHIIATASGLAIAALLAHPALGAGGPSHGTIGNSNPRPGAAAAIRAAGLDDGGGSDDSGGGSRDDGGAPSRGHHAHHAHAARSRSRGGENG